MIPIVRHAFTAILFGLLITILILVITFFAFPIDDWRLIYTYNIGDVPFVLFIISVPVIIGSVFGITTGLFWRQRFYRINRQLDELAKGHNVTFDDEPYRELQQIQYYVEQVQEKIRKHTEHAQRLATERAHEREKSLQEIVVQERNRLARELHDSVSQQLFAASMMMSAINESADEIDPSVNKQLNLVEKMIHQSQLEMRALLLHLRPVALKGKSLQDGVKELLVELKQKVPLTIEWKVEEFALDKGIEDQLFRILQESVSNTLRHAEASSLHVMLIERDDTIILRVVDDGVGFDTSQVRTTGSYGLSNMKERAYEVGGTIKIISLPNQGTRLEVKVPSLRKGNDNDD
ncbi:two-component system, NarL family, sensor histidine kinase LiaS [Oceanobacillus limi]|uniref:Sensor histidine kinase n=1 Tax=Oceanobacillus limi TaxID=930131 RepID=A0A1I0DTI9_9BACI|nr:sensor histidine kinase [Oceanobacillus limi]SET35518.1 two-component system, NarL family, sensor histidine kinase LiaS [Oceanobacillus limi]